MLAIHLRLWSAAFAVCVLTCAAVARPLTDTNGSATFSVEDLLSGTTSTQPQCQAIGTAVWVTVDGKGDCIRFYAANLRAGPNPVVLVFFHGDVLDGRRVLSAYDRASPDSVQKIVAAWSAESGNLPAIYIARPGTYGSSGDHSQRRRP